MRRSTHDTWYVVRGTKIRSQAFYVLRSTSNPLENLRSGFERTTHHAPRTTVLEPKHHFSEIHWFGRETFQVDPDRAEPKTLHSVTFVGQDPESFVIDLQSTETLTPSFGVVNPDQKSVESRWIKAGRQGRSEHRRFDSPLLQRRSKSQLETG